MRTLRSSSTLFIAVIYQSPNPWWVKAYATESNVEQFQGSTALRHRRHVINVEPPIAKSTRLVEPSRLEVVNEAFDLAVEWERLLKRDNSMSLSLSMPQEQPEPDPVDTEDEPPTSTPVSSPVSAPVEEPAPEEPPVDELPTEPDVPISPLPSPVTSPTVDPTPLVVPETSFSPSTKGTEMTNTSMAPVTTEVPVEAPENQEESETTPPNSTSECAALDRADAMRAAISAVTTEVDLDTDSPSGFAVNWLTNDDPAQLDPCIDNVVQRYALAALYSSTEGDSWTNSSGWLTEASECDWFGVECIEDSGDVGTIELRTNNLAGSLPEDLRALSELQVLDVFSNSLVGSIPESISELSDLTLFDVEENQLSGPAFVNVSGLRNLASYRVSINSLTGGMPDDWPSSVSASLKELWAASNNLAGTLPGASIGQLTELSSLILYNNLFTGTLPSELGALTLLEQLQLQSNKFVSTVPVSVFTLTQLQDLRFDTNQFTGSLSSRIGDLTELRDLRIGGNSFTGTLPPQIARLSNLGILQVNGTQMEGAIRDSFEPFLNLRFVDLSNNLFTGPMPGSLFDVPTLEILYLYGNALTGSIPSNYGKASNLRDLYLNDNALVGMVPPIEPSQLGTLTEFRLENNQLTGSMPASICALRGDNRETDLFALIADCGGSTPQLQCDCCNSCTV